MAYNHCNAIGTNYRSFGASGLLSVPLPAQWTARRPRGLDPMSQAAATAAEKTNPVMRSWRLREEGDLIGTFRKPDCYDTLQATLGYRSFVGDHVLDQKRTEHPGCKLRLIERGGGGNSFHERLYTRRDAEQPAFQQGRHGRFVPICHPARLGSDKHIIPTSGDQVPRCIHHPAGAKTAVTERPCVSTPEKSKKLTNKGCFLSKIQGNSGITLPCLLPMSGREVSGRTVLSENRVKRPYYSSGTISAQDARDLNSVASTPLWFNAGHINIEVPSGGFSFNETFRTAQGSSMIYPQILK